MKKKNIIIIVIAFIVVTFIISLVAKIINEPHSNVYNITGNQLFIKMETDDTSKEYTLDTSLFIDWSETNQISIFENYSHYEIVNYTLDTRCSAIMTIVYDYKNIPNPESNILVQNMPEVVWISYEPVSVIVTAYDGTGSEEYGMCNITENGIGKEIYIS